MTNKIKKSYFQGGGGENEPTPKKTKYKKEPLDQDDTKSRGVFFQNYDLYDTGNPTPGTGLYQHMNEYDSVADFRKNKRDEKLRKRRQSMFEALMVSTASDLIEIKKEKLNKLYEMLNEFDKLATEDINNLTDPTEDVVTPILNSAPPGGSPIGLMDGVYPEESVEEAPIGNLYYGGTETHRIEANKK